MLYARGACTLSGLWHPRHHHTCRINECKAEVVQLLNLKGLALQMYSNQYICKAYYSTVHLSCLVDVYAGVKVRKAYTAACLYTLECKHAFPVPSWLASHLGRVDLSSERHGSPVGALGGPAT